MSEPTLASLHHGLVLFQLVNKLGPIPFRDDKTVSEFLPHQAFVYVKMSYVA
jgi:hypothetical protein